MADVRFNPTEWQSMVDGAPVKVSELTRNQLEQELCYSMDIIENMETKMQELESKLQELQYFLNKWHRGIF